MLYTRLEPRFHVVILTSVYAPDDVFFMTLCIAHNDCIIMIAIGLI